MPLAHITEISGQVVPVPGNDVDTDRIIPARFMKCVTFDGLGEYAFFDARFHEDGASKPHPLNEPQYQDASVMLVGINFGCGSSREHAPQSLHKAGFRALIGLSFAEIFFGNATTLGMPCVTVDAATHAALTELVQANPSVAVKIDLENQQVRFGDQAFACEMPSSAREALVNGIWDPIALLIEGPEAVAEVARKNHYVS